MLFVSDSIKYKFKTLTHSYSDLPSISLEIGIGRATRTLVNYYYREWTSGINGDSSLIGQIDRLERHINQWKELMSDDRDFVNLGDANMCALSWDQSDYRHKNLSQLVKTFLLESSCHQLVNTWTRVLDSGDTLQKSCLDHVVTNVPNKCNVPEVSAGGVSDHMAVMVTKRTREIQNQPKTIRKRNYKNFDQHSFLMDIADSFNRGKFDSILNATDPDIAASHFSGIFNVILNRHAPLKTFHVRNNYAPWISQKTKEDIAQRNKLKVEASRENSLDKFNQYKSLRNKIKSQLAKDEVNYYRDKFYDPEASISSIWNQVNDCLGTGNRSYSNTPSMIVHQGIVHRSPRDIANTLNKIFLDKVKRLTSLTGVNPTIEPKERLRQWLNTRVEPIPVLELQPIDNLKFRKIIGKLKGNRSCGMDFIDGFSIKLAAPILEPVLIHLLNLNIIRSKFPISWKSTKVNPLFKKGDRLDGENYRPVSDIIFVSKITEAVVFEQIYQHFQSNGLWHPNHHGFKAHHSTTTALAQLYDLWVRGSEERELTAALLLDLSAAFDVVNHGILIEKLELYNFSPATCAWFRSYLSNRSQYVMVESRLSDPLPVGNQGVPQGSLLGPLCFMIFYNDFPAVRESGESVLYADDDTDCCSSKDPLDLQQKIQHEANLSTMWVNDNQLVCSGAKTKLLIIGTRELRNSKLSNHNISISINVAGHQIQESISERLLGMIVNNTLTWHDHLYGNNEHKGLLQKLSQRAGLIRKLSKLMPPARLKIIANGIFFRYLTMGFKCMEVCLVY